MWFYWIRYQVKKYHSCLFWEPSESNLGPTYHHSSMIHIVLNPGISDMVLATAIHLHHLQGFVENSKNPYHIFLVTKKRYLVSLPAHIFAKSQKQKKYQVKIQNSQMAKNWPSKSHGWNYLSTIIRHTATFILHWGVKYIYIFCIWFHYFLLKGPVY